MLKGSRTLPIVRGRIRFADLSDYIAGLAEFWDCEHDQLTAPASPWWCRYVTDGQAVLYEEQYGIKLFIQGSPAGDFFVFGIPCRPELGGRWIGEDLPHHGLGYTRSRTELEMLFQPGGRTLCAMVPTAPFREAYTTLSGLPPERTFPAGHRFKQYSADRWRDLRDAWRQILRRADAMTDLVTELAASLVNFGDPQDLVRERYPVRARAVFRRALDACADAGDSFRPATLARSIGVSLRSLETAFRQCSDLPPARFLRLQRMNAVHLALVAADPARSRVTDLATNHGFTELGRFAVEYRQLFGERPSETLRRAARKRF
ncbi:MAG: AraC family transcriptional regulator [Verrucomicrobiae bacterium]|nr:AraC family transcriptional regulator [Verrucomicrobiae bacterium]